MQRNPYYHRGPIRQPEHFFGRAMAVKRVIEMLSEGQSISLIGPRRIGKTSFLFHISNPETLRRHGIDPSTILMVYVQCEGLADLSPTELYGVLLSELLAQLPPVQWPEEVNANIGLGHRDLFRRFDALVAQGTRTQGSQKIVFLFDEFELLARNPHLDQGFFSFLRGMAARHPVAFVSATTSPLLELCDEAAALSSPFFNIFYPLRLGLFPIEEAYTLIARPAEAVDTRFPPELVKIIYDLAGGHPFLIQVACYHAFDILASKGRFEESDYADLRVVVRSELESHFEYYWRHLSDEERLVLISLSTEEPTWPVRQVMPVIEVLEINALVARQGSSYSLFSSVFAEFVRDRAGGMSGEMRELYTSLQEVRRATELKPQEFVHKASRFVEYLCHRLDFTILSQSLLPDSRLSLFALDTKGFFQGIRLPSILPLLFIQRDRLLESDLDKIRQYLSDEMGTAHRVALLALLAEEHAARRAKKLLLDKLRQVYAYDVTLLSTDDWLRISVAEDPAQELRRQILPHTDLVTTSPFVITGPTTDDIFFGREHELREITDSVGFSSFAVIGGRRIGKSSLLGRLHRIRLPAAGFRTACHDCSTTPAYEAFLTTPIRDWCPGQPSDAPATLGDLLQSTPDDKPFVLLLDEADKLVPADRANNWRLFNALRALATSGQAQFLLSGERTLRDALRDPIGPLFNFANEMLLGLLDFGAVEELVTRPMKQLEIELVDEEAIVNSIWAFTSGHPNVVQRLCHRLIERLNEQGTRRIAVDDVSTVIEDPQFQEVDFLQTYWEAASPLEKVITLLLSREDRACRLKEVRQLLSEQASIQPSATATKEALDRLVDLRSILKRSQAGYSFAVEAFPRVLANTTTVEDLLEVLVEQYGRTEARA